jgi:hypothetical protein
MTVRSQKLVLLCSFSFLSAFLLANCGASPNSAAARGEKAFSSAPAETRTFWMMATTAIRTNDLALALATLGKLHSTQGLTPEQTKAVEATSTALSDRLYSAANRGDPNAKRALDDLRMMHAR